MVRTLVCGLVALVMVVGLALTAEAAKGKKGKRGRGTITKVDEKTGILTVTVKKKKETEEITIDPKGKDKDVKFFNAEGSPIDAKELKEGTKVSLKKDEGGKLIEVKIGGKKKKKNK